MKSRAGLLGVSSEQKGGMSDATATCHHCTNNNVVSHFPPPLNVISSPNHAMQVAIALTRRARLHPATTTAITDAEVIAAMDMRWLRQFIEWLVWPVKMSFAAATRLH